MIRATVRTLAVVVALGASGMATATLVHSGTKTEPTPPEDASPSSPPAAPAPLDRDTEAPRHPTARELLVRVARERAVATLELVAVARWRDAVEAATRSVRRGVRPARARVTPSAQGHSGSGRCGGDLPPCCVMARESGGDIRAENPVSTASGKWQFIDGTWAGFGGYAHASDAPEAVQDARARELWAGGAGASHWGGGC